MNALIDEFNTPLCPLKVYGVPCNQFGMQEPGVGNEIFNSIEYVRPGNGFKTKMDLLVKRKVNGKNEDSLFTWLKSLCRNPSNLIGERDKLFYTPIRTTDIKWNFEKFLIDHKGRPRKRYTPLFLPRDMKQDIQKLVDECKNGKKQKVVFEDVFQDETY